MTESSDDESVQVFIGINIGKDTYHAVGVNRSGKRLFDIAFPNDENKLRALIYDLKQHGQILLVVDQPATISALPVAVASPGRRPCRIPSRAGNAPYCLSTHW
jgi:hypothetical protein